MWEGVLVKWGSYPMKAAVFYKSGGIESCSVEEVPEPKPLKDEVVVKIKTASLNHLDLWVLKGRSGEKITQPHIFGSDGAGVVFSVGPDVTGVQEGDEVIVNPGLICGWCPQCRSGETSQCETFGIVGMSRPGTYAERIALPARNIWPKPAHLSFVEASAFTLTYLTAWRMLFTKGKLVEGQTVLIHGIGGGVALSALQLAKIAGAEVIVTSSSDEKLKSAKQLGADHIINYKTTKDVAAAVKEKTKGRGVDLAIDSVGAATWPIDLEAVRRGGTIVLCGITTGSIAQTDLQLIYWNHLKIFGSTLGSDGEMISMLKAVETAKLKPIIDSVHKLSNVQQALKRMESGEQFGKIVLKVSD